MSNRSRRREARARRMPPVLAPCPTPAKQRYADESDARRATIAYARVHIKEGRHFDPMFGYLCPCGGWHMTRKPRWDGHDHVLLYEIAEHLQRFAGVVDDDQAAEAS